MSELLYHEIHISFKLNYLCYLSSVLRYSPNAFFYSLFGKLSVNPLLRGRIIARERSEFMKGIPLVSLVSFEKQDQEMCLVKMVCVQIS